MTVKPLCSYLSKVANSMRSFSEREPYVRAQYDGLMEGLISAIIINSVMLTDQRIQYGAIIVSVGGLLTMNALPGNAIDLRKQFPRKAVRIVGTMLLAGMLGALSTDSVIARLWPQAPEQEKQSDPIPTRRKSSLMALNRNNLNSNVDWNAPSV